MSLWAFALLPLAVLFWLWQQTSLSDLTRPRRRNSTVVRIVLFAILVLALSDPRLLLEQNRTQVVFVADASDSLGETALQRIPDLQNFPGESPRSLVIFGGRAESAALSEDGSPPLPGPVDPTRSRIAEALRFAEATVPAGRAPTLVLLSDGRSNGEDLGAIAEEFRSRAVRVHTVPIDPPDQPEILLHSISAPGEANPQEPFPVEVDITSNHETAATLEIFRNGALSAEREVELRPGNNRFSFTERAGEEGVVAITAAVRAGEAQDTFIDNNRSTAHVRTGEESRILLLSDRPESLRFLSRALRQEGFRLDIRPPTGLPETMAGLSVSSCSTTFRPPIRRPPRCP